MAGDRIFEHYNFAQGDRDPDLVERYAGSGVYRRILDYLASDDQIPRQRSYVGNVDRYDEDRVTGWAADLSRDEPIEVSVQRAGEVVQRARCVLRRDDLALKGYPRGYLGFKMELGQLTGNPRDYAICFEETRIRVPGSA